MNQQGGYGDKSPKSRGRSPTPYHYPQYQPRPQQYGSTPEHYDRYYEDAKFQNYAHSNNQQSSYPKYQEN